MKSVEEILAEASFTIAHVHNRPSMYIASTMQPRAADAMDGILRIAHWFWATIQDREDEYGNVLSAVRKRHECSSQGFPDAFRRLNPDADEAAAFQFVMSSWQEVDAELGIDVSADACRSG